MNICMLKQKCLSCAKHHLIYAAYNFCQCFKNRFKRHYCIKYKNSTQAISMKNKETQLQFQPLSSQAALPWASGCTLQKPPAKLPKHCHQLQWAQCFHMQKDPFWLDCFRTSKFLPPRIVYYCHYKTYTIWKLVHDKFTFPTSLSNVIIAFLSEGWI